MDATQQAALQGAIQGAEAAAAIGVGVASVADPRVAAAMQAAQLALQLTQTVQQISAIQTMTPAENAALWNVNAKLIAANHQALLALSQPAASPAPVAVTATATPVAPATADTAPQPAVPANPQ